MPRIYCQALALTGLPDLRHESPLVSVSVSSLATPSRSTVCFFFSIALDFQTELGAQLRDLLVWKSDSAENGLGLVVGGGSEGSDVCGLELDTGGGSGAANIGGGNVCMPSGTGGGVGLGTDVAVAGDSCEAVLLLQVTHQYV